MSKKKQTVSEAMSNLAKEFALNSDINNKRSQKEKIPESIKQEQKKNNSEVLKQPKKSTKLKSVKQSTLTEKAKRNGKINLSINYVPKEVVGNFKLGAKKLLISQTAFLEILISNWNETKTEDQKKILETYREKVLKEYTSKHNN